MTFICQGSFHINCSNITGHQHTVTVSEMHEKLCSFEARDLVVLCKYLIALKLFCLLMIFPEVAQNSPSFHDRRNPPVLAVFQVCGTEVSGHDYMKITDCKARFKCHLKWHFCFTFSLYFNDLCAARLIIIIITMTMFMVLSSWHSHCESSPGSFDECRLIVLV